MSKNQEPKNYGTIALVVAALLLLTGIIAYSWNKKPASEQVNETETQNESTSNKTVELGPNEVKITAQNFEQEVVKSDKLAVVDVYAPWCPHCQKLAPIITDLSNEYVGRVKIGKLNADNQDPAQRENYNFAIKEGLSGYPGIWIYKDGKRVETLSGSRTKEELKEIIEKYLK